MTESSANWTVEVRPVTESDIKLCRAEGKVNVVDSGAAVLLDGELVAVTDEYGTAYLRAGTRVDHPDALDLVERLAESVSDLYCSAGAHG